MLCIKGSFRELDCFDNDLENNAWKLEYNAEKLQEILNRTMEGIIITSILLNMHLIIITV